MKSQGSDFYLSLVLRKFLTQRENEVSFHWKET